MVQDGQDDLVHVLPQAEVDVLLFLNGLDELGSHGGKGGEQVNIFHVHLVIFFTFTLDIVVPSTNVRVQQ